VKSLRTCDPDNFEYLSERAFVGLENVGSKLMKASNVLDKTIQLLIETYPDVAILANTLPMMKGQHPYWQIKQAGDLYKYIYSRHIVLTHQLSSKLTTSED
jgi:hypothetical protein